ncbi:hypothetical protein AK51_01455 [Serratia nematodiphila DZ0503SBS1]|nr:hypothetical protein AK51_01455 [Serratia nematodiphila DZ0503SBS1]
MEYQHWLKAAAARLTHSDSARRDAEILLGFVTGRARTFLMAFGETVLTPPQQQQLETLLARRERGEPVAIWWASASFGRCRCRSRPRR